MASIVLNSDTLISLSGKSIIKLGCYTNSEFYILAIVFLIYMFDHWSVRLVLG